MNNDGNGSNNPFNFIIYNLKVIQQKLLEQDKKIDNLTKRVDSVEKNKSNLSIETNTVVKSPKNSSKVLDQAKKSVVKIFNSGKLESFISPGFKEKFSATGTGFVTSYNGKNYIVTNSHVISGGDSITVSLTKGDKTYKANVKVNATKCDLAILTVDDKEFWKKAEPLKLKEKYGLNTNITVVGFPTGGRDVSVTSGKISRTGSSVTAHGHAIFKDIQISAAVNPGNSGGPVIYEKNGKFYVVGVVYQLLQNSQNIGYMIPAKTLQHLFKLSEGKEYKGFPEIFFDAQNLMNDFQRESVYGLKKGQTGILVSSVPKISACFGKIKEDDVIIKMNGIKLDNTGMIKDPITGSKIHLNSQIREYNIGDEVTFTIIRNKKEMDIKVKLKNTVGKLSVLQDKYSLPTWYINSNVMFSNLTYNFFEEARQSKEFIQKYAHAFQDLSVYSGKVKSSKDEEAVIILDMFGKDTVGYGINKYAVVDKVNGKKINNLKDLVVAMESNKKDIHTIILRGKDKKMHLKNIGTYKDYNEMLDEAGKFSHCSKDLENFSNLKKQVMLNANLQSVNNTLVVNYLNKASENKQKINNKMDISNESNNLELKKMSEKSYGSRLVVGQKRKFANI